MIENSPREADCVVAATNREMVRAVLAGSHSHKTRAGVEVHVYLRSQRFLARGYFEGQRFGETLGATEPDATARLRELMVEIDNGVYVRPSEARKRPLRKITAVRATFRQLVEGFLADVRKRRGLDTTQTYQSRLFPILDFVERPENRKRWATAAAIDRDFVVTLRAFLFECKVTPNGKPGARPNPMSVRTVRNVLECLRTMLTWARRPDVRFLPADWTNPVTPDLIGPVPSKDPLREDPLPVAIRIKLVERMDAWQLCQLGLSMVLPLRPNEAVGLLVSEVDFAKNWLKIGTRLRGADFTKARNSYTLPFPPEMRLLLKACIGDRSEGPLLRRRNVFLRSARAPKIDMAELVRLYEQKLAGARSGEVQNEQDRKRLFRCLLRELGGVSEDMLAKEFDRLVGAASINSKLNLYSLRHATTKGLKDTKMSQLDLLYLTSHTTNSILNEYTSVDPVRAMGEYFKSIRELLTAIEKRSQVLGLDGLAG